MGAFLSEPVTEKVSVDEEHSRLNFGVCSMQGWRFTQEDNHSCCPKLDEDSALFGVYDGHGGAEVSRYVASLLPDYVLARECWEKGEVGKALSEAFLALDAHLGSRKGLKVLKRLAAEDDAALDHEKKSSAEDDAESEDGSEENVRNLFKEAKMPLQLLMAKYGQALAACQNEEDEAAEGSPTGSKSAKGGASSAEGDAASSEEGGSSTAVKKGEEGGGSGSSEDAAAPKENGLPEESVEGAKATKNGSGGRSKLRSRPVRMLMTDEDDDEEDDSSDEEYDENSSSLMEEEAEGESSGDEEDDDDDEDGDDDEESLEDSISTSDKFALNMLQGPGLDSGCTAVVAVVRKGGVLYVANAGDSRCILSRKGRAIDMSVDHKPEDEAESERIKAAGGEVTSEGRVNGGLNLSRALGDHAYKQGTDVGARQQMISALPDVRRVQLRKDEDEFMLLACDGIWNSMTSQEVVDFVRERLYKDAPKGDSAEDVQERRKAAKGVKLSEICGDMFETCLAPNTLGDGTGCDNMTAVLVTFRDDLWDGSAVDVVAKVEKKGKEGVELKADSKKEEDSSDSKKDEEDEKEDDDEEDHGIALLTPPPSPPPVVVEGDEEEETSEEEEEEEEDEEEEEEEEGEEDALAEEAEEDEGVEEDEVSNGRSGKGKGSKRRTDTSTDTPLPKLKKRKVERAAEEDGEKEADTVSPAS